MERPYLLLTLRGWKDQMIAMNFKDEADQADILLQHTLDLGIHWEPAIPLVHDLIDTCERKVREGWSHLRDKKPPTRTLPNPLRKT
jgi:hypothetical protein